MLQTANCFTGDQMAMDSATKMLVWRRSRQEDIAVEWGT